MKQNVSRIHFYIGIDMCQILLIIFWIFTLRQRTLMSSLWPPPRFAHASCLDQFLCYMASRWICSLCLVILYFDVPLLTILWLFIGLISWTWQTWEHSNKIFGFYLRLNFNWFRVSGWFVCSQGIFSYPCIVFHPLPSPFLSFYDKKNSNGRWPPKNSK